MRLDEQGGVVKDSKAIDNMGAEIGINVFGGVLPNTATVPGPVGEVAHNLVVVL